jgi:hypothetical protein
MRHHEHRPGDPRRRSQRALIKAKLCESTSALTVFVRALVMLLFTACAGAPGDGDLTPQELGLFLRSYDRYAELLTRNVAKNSASDVQGQKKDEFPALMARVTQALDQAEKAACKESGMSRSQYRSVLQRVLAVQEYEMLLSAKLQLEEEIATRENRDDAARKAAAERAYQDLEDWFAPYERSIGKARHESEEKKRRYLEVVEAANQKIDADNRALAPDPLLLKMRDRKAAHEQKLTDPRFAEVHDQIRDSISELDLVLLRLEKKQQRRKKSRKEPSPIVLRGFESEVTRATQARDSYADLVMKAPRHQKASGQWLATVKAHDAKKTREQRQSISEAEANLATPRMTKAAKDSPVVLQVLGRKKLRLISPS